jgi:ABC transporter substrate binding protein
LVGKKVATFVSYFCRLRAVTSGDLIAQQVDVIVTFGDPATRAAQQTTKIIPIIAMSDDIVGSGLTTSLARPGGNTTGKHSCIGARRKATGNPA